MPFADQQRKQWQEKLSQGEIPKDVQEAIDIYKKMREDPYWRSSSLFERLGEAAIALEKNIKKGVD